MPLETIHFISFHFSQPDLRPSQRASQASGWAGPQIWLAGPQTWLDGPEGGTDGWMNKRTENLPILQDFVPYQGRCPKSEKEGNKFVYTK